MKQFLIGSLILVFLMGPVSAMAERYERGEREHNGSFQKVERDHGGPKHKKFLTSRSYDDHRRGGHRDKHDWRDQRGKHGWGHKKHGRGHKKHGWEKGHGWKGKHGWKHGHKKHHYRYYGRHHRNEHKHGRYHDDYRYRFRYDAGYPDLSNGRLRIDLVGR